MVDNKCYILQPSWLVLVWFIYKVDQLPVTVTTKYCTACKQDKLPVTVTIETRGTYGF